MWCGLAEGCMSLGTGFEGFKALPDIQYILCFVFAVENVMSQLPALATCCYAFLTCELSLWNHTLK